MPTKPNHLALLFAGIMLILASTLLGGGLAGAEEKPQSTNVPHRVRLIVTVGQAAPYPDQIFLAGSINNWIPGVLAIPHVGDGIYARTFKWNSGKIEYKFTREANWESVEKGLYGAEVANRILIINDKPAEIVAYHHVARWADQDQAIPTLAVFSSQAGRIDEPSAASPKSTLTGDVRTIDPIDVPQLGSQRQVLVYLPPGYDDSEDRYPVLYMLDGQNVFDAGTSFIGVEWGLDEIAEAGILAGKQHPCIIVAVYNSANRINEYTPYADPKHGGGEADKFLAFLVETLKPQIDTRFRTKPGREHTALAGSSLGGLLSLYAATTQHETFTRFGVIAPSLQWADYKMVSALREAKLPEDLHFWIEVGVGSSVLGKMKDTLMGEKPRLNPYHSACREVSEILREKGFTDPGQLHYREDPSWFHDEKSWSKRSESMLHDLIP
jgi:predicted alpha/beta superfamily hydrolase